MYPLLVHNFYLLFLKVGGSGIILVGVWKIVIVIILIIKPLISDGRISDDCISFLLPMPMIPNFPNAANL